MVRHTVGPYGIRNDIFEKISMGILCFPLNMLAHLCHSIVINSQEVFNFENDSIYIEFS